MGATVIDPQWLLAFSDVLNPQGEGYYYTTIKGWTVPIEQNSVWKITWEDVTYICTATEILDTGGSGYCIGNCTLDGGTTGNNEPFLMQVYEGWDAQGDALLVAAETPGSYTVTIEKFIADNIDYLTTTAELTSIANAIRSKGGTSAQLVYPTDFINAINAIITNPTLQAKTNINPLTTSQTIQADSGYYGLSSVQINAMPSGSARTPATTITSQPIISINSSGLITATNSKTQNVTPTVTAGYVSSGTAGTITVSGSNTSQLTTQSAQTLYPSTSDQTITSGQYLTGTQTFKAVTHTVTAANVKYNATVKIGDAADDDRVASVTGTFTASNSVSSGQTAAAAAQIRSGYSAWVNGAEVKGSLGNTSVTQGTTTVSSNTATRGTASWGNGVITAGSISAATFGSTVASGKTANSYVDISATTDAPVLVSGDYLYINQGYTDNIKISLAKLVPDGSDVKGHQEYLLSGHSAYDDDGVLVSGSIPTITLPTSAASSATSGYTSKATIGRSTSAQYINIPPGYNATGGYYTISAVANGSATTPATTITSEPTITVGSDGLITATNSKTQSVTPTVNAGYVSSGTAGTITVSGSKTSQLSTQAAVTITPTESEQTAVAAGKYTTGAVKVGAISSTYVGSGITTRTSSDVTASGATVTVPAGYYASQVSKSVTTMTLPTSASSSATSGYTSKATISRSTSDQYINIAPGYNSAGGYYKISAVANGSATGPNSLSGSSATVTTGTNTITLTKTGVTTTPTVSAGYVASATASTATVTLTASVTTQAAKTVTPTESEQTAVAASVYTTGAVKVAAISSTYVGSAISQRSSSDLTVSGATVTVPAGYYSTQASKSVSTMTLPTSAISSAASGYTSKATISRSTSDQYINIPTGYNSAGAYYKISAVANGSATAPASISGTSATVSTGTNTLTLTKTVSVTPSVTAGYISSGTAGNSSVSLTASVTTKAAATITPTTTDQTIASGTYLTGTQTIKGNANLTAANIKTGVAIFGVTGTYTSDANATADDILLNKTAYVNGVKLTGTIPDGDSIAYGDATAAAASSYINVAKVGTATAG